MINHAAESENRVIANVGIIISRCPFLLVLISASITTFCYAFDVHVGCFDWKLTERSGALLILVSIFIFYCTIFLYSDKQKIVVRDSGVNYIKQEEYQSTPKISLASSNTRSKKSNIKTEAMLQRRMLEDTLQKLTKSEVILAGIGTIVWGFAGINEITTMFVGWSASLLLFLSCIVFSLPEKISAVKPTEVGREYQLRERRYAKVGGFVSSIFAASPYVLSLIVC